MRYVKGKPKGCKACHREKQRTRPCDAEQKRAYAQSHRDEINTRRRAWRAVNRPDAVEFINGDDLAVEYARIIDGDPCVYCGRPGIEKDHIIAVASGGTGEWINLAPICRRCNASKQDRDVLRFMLRRLVLAA
jgi:5-methylcytosine-specific restriction endonuclease McrA